MRKFLIILCAFVFLGTEIAWAQAKYPLFSSSLGGGGYGYYRRGVRRSVYRPYGGGRVYGEATTVFAGPKKITAPRKKIVIKYKPGQIELSEDLMEKLMPMIRRLQDGKVKSLEVIGICKDYNTTSHRQLSLDKILHSYSPNLEINFREISGPAVVNSNDNTMEFVEYW